MFLDIWDEWTTSVDVAAAPTCSYRVCLREGAAQAAGRAGLCGQRQDAANKHSSEPQYVASTLMNQPRLR